MKISSSDILSLLRGFKIAESDAVPRHIERLKVSHPSNINTGAEFIYNKQTYLVLFDETAADRADYLLDQFQKISPNIKGDLVINPRSEVEAYGYPFKGKDAYLFLQDSGTERLDTYLARTFPEYSRSTWQKYIKLGYVTVDSEVVTSPKVHIEPTTTVTPNVPAKPTYSDKQLDILYMDDNVVVIDKPVGILTHAKNPLDDEFTVAHFMRQYTTVALDTDRPGIVHRLDRDTSGVIICARNDAAFDMLKQQFSDRTATKTYHAASDHTPKIPAAIIDAPIARNTSKSGTFTVHPSGKPAQTGYRIVDTNGQSSLIELTPRTGRTHQIRVHLAYINCPIRGDYIYGKPADRLYLHAHSLRISIPEYGEMTFTSPTPFAL